MQIILDSLIWLAHTLCISKTSFALLCLTLTFWKRKEEQRGKKFSPKNSNNVLRNAYYLLWHRLVLVVHGSMWWVSKRWQPFTEWKLQLACTFCTLSSTWLPHILFCSACFIKLFYVYSLPVLKYAFFIWNILCLIYHNF